jgi:hypothetical protein
LNRSHQLADFSEFDFDTHVVSFWVSSWNRDDNEVRARLDTSFTGHDSHLLGPYSRSVGPEISVAHVFPANYRVDFSYEYKYNHDNDDAPEGDPNRRGGHEHVLSAILSYPGGNKGIQPYAGYSLGRNLTDGWNFSTITHGFRAGTYYLIGQRTSVDLGGSYEYEIYPTNDVPRADTLKTLHLILSLPTFRDLLVFNVGTEYIMQDSVLPDLTYKRWRLGLQMVVHLDI